ncbi:beta-N-acetylhexosaminidase [Glaciecola sp. KUL10]|uniref:beta-N-acetylhexosaminidase n=1 Tax=Glaciecola sp. (strain KUL10) TaxID=2161813 RepID=UPI000D78A348|nr:beta-N-acetylhexosaminidase [Glaciecola sp. KUL10]GBL03093.1 glycoside hydrolase family protein [Glaciecola sp. KUL10]
MGPIIIDIEAFALSQVEREKLAHPLVGGIILFSRNYAEVSQLKALIKDIRETVKRPFLVAVDHEGGRVQRFIEGFTHIPSMGAITSIVNTKEQQALAKAMGFVMAKELIDCDIDLSFAPVLDLNRGSQVIGLRSFSSEVEKTIDLATHYINGMSSAGMKSCGKHFPGHGSVLEDSHVAMPIDTREFDDIKQTDMAVFSRLITLNKLSALMPAHVIFNKVDDLPAGFSKRWLQDVLRQQLGFKGVIFSDDLSMQAATAIKCVTERAQAALKAGCTMALVCNAPDQAEKVLDGLSIKDFNTHAKLAESLLISTNIKNPSIHSKSLNEAHKVAKTLIASYELDGIV